ncbi:stage II sporulation protein M [Thermincola potens JR]|uniref:Stage II sporulation protein M n=1 Tax=Thermincola potens (strain JR) TaxID=635013 RepID=D5X7E7_THEPJ|nr:stage II sporulation protein M [Thermincola potens]ADG82517.1 stage II sporulation protein M [Thermincola potens JR]
MLLRLKRACRQYFRNNWLLGLILVIFFMAGLIFGAIGAKSLDQGMKNELSNTMQNFITKVPGLSLDKKAAIKGSLVQNMYVILTMYILGLSVVGGILVPVLVFTRGFTLGFTVGFLAYDQAWKGVLLSIVSVIPQNLIFIPVLLISGMFTLTFSVFFAKSRFMFREFEAGRPALFYTVGMGCAAVMTGAGCLMEAYITPSLIKYSIALLF